VRLGLGVRVGGLTRHVRYVGVFAGVVTGAGGGIVFRFGDDGGA